MNLIRRFVNRISNRRSFNPIQRRLALYYDFISENWVVVSRWTGEACDLKEVRKVFGLIRDFYCNAEYAEWVDAYNTIQRAETRNAVQAEWLTYEQMKLDGCEW